MKRTLLLSIATLAFSGLLAAPGFAQNPNTAGAGPGVVDPGHPRVNEVNQRQQNQQNRIANGEKSGALTPHESAKLERQQQHIDHSGKEGHGGAQRPPDQRRAGQPQQGDRTRPARNIYAKKHNDAVR